MDTFLEENLKMLNSKTQAELLNVLRREKPYLVKTFGMRKLALFGSYAREENSSQSDIDLLVEFNGVSTAKNYFGLLHYLEDTLGENIDLVTVKALRKEIEPFVKKDMIDV